MKLRSGILKKGSYGAYTPSEPCSGWEGLSRPHARACLRF